MKKIMIVDDEPGVLYTVKTGLEALDDSYEVITVESGKECLDHLEEANPDLIILDLMMPGMSGWTTYDKIRDQEKWQKTPIIFLTARTDDIAKRAGNFLAEDYLEKPVDVMVIKERIEKLMNKNKEK
ncbi:MAG TPA: response regulator [Candidatus Thermoplasmatota archaeon]|nr:response regulator [Candidatus Thermoplasmatota archaeon]